MNSRAVALIRCVLPARLHRALLTVASAVLRTFRVWLGRGPAGCAMIVQDEADRVLLVRHSYVEPDTWMLPTGGMRRGELPLPAAAREVREEVRIDGTEAGMVEFEGTTYWGMDFQTYIVGMRASEAPVPDGREILAAEFFALDQLPENTSLPTVERLNRWRFRRSLPIEVPSFVRPDYVASPLFRQRRRQAGR